MNIIHPRRSAYLAAVLQGSTPLNQVDNNNDYGDHQQEMDKTSHGIAAYQPKQPHNQQYYYDCPQHVILLRAALSTLFV
jgi:hypothetical protein